MQPRNLLGVAAVLAAVAGCVDAVYFGRVAEVFPANQSGNAVLLGIGIGRASGAMVWPPAVSILGFGVGVAAATVLRRRVAQQWRALLLLGLEIALLVPLAIVLAGTTGDAVVLTGPESGVLLVSTAIAMGLQTEVIGRVAGVQVATTYQSGTIARLAESAGHRAPAGSDDQVAPSGLVTLAAVLAAYVAGAALGATVRDWDGSLFVPIGLVGAVAASVALAPTRSRP